MQRIGLGNRAAGPMGLAIGALAALAASLLPTKGASVGVVQEQIPVVYQAVGTVRPRLEAQVMAQVSGLLLSVAVTDGQTVKAGQELATLEDRELTLRISQARRGIEEAVARQMQARHGHTGAQALRVQTQTQYERVQRYVTKNAATAQELEQAEAAYRQAQAMVDAAEETVKAATAAVERARDLLAEAEVARGYTRVVSPFAGIVVKRLVEPGDLAWPGRPLFRISDPSRMRLEANVRESLASKVGVGQVLTVSVDAIGQSLSGTVAEVVPAADPDSRTFLVKVDLPADSRLLSGMFGRLAVPVGQRPALLVPVSAIRRLGQLIQVRVLTPEGWRVRLVRTGARHGDRVEVLSGLAAGEQVASAAEPGGAP